MVKIVVAGTRFGRLVALEKVVGTRYPVRCRCDCGTEKQIRCAHLLYGKIVSCGCHRREMNVAHGYTGKTEVWRHMPEYNVWQVMRGRCANPNNQKYHAYGARGISVCERWQRFDNFIADMGRRPSDAHSIDRIDNDGNYEPSNCRWATSKEQANNTSRNIVIEMDGARRTLTEWAEVTGLSFDTIYGRIRRGWTAVDALTAPRCGAVRSEHAHGPEQE